MLFSNQNDQIPFGEWVYHTSGWNCYTPDYPQLNIWKTHFVFTYGSLMQGMARGMDKIMSTATLIGKYRTKSPLYTMGYSVFGYPYVMGGERNGDFIDGEIWEIPTGMMSDLDNIESNTQLYQRVPRLFINREGVELPAWIYLGMRSAPAFSEKNTSNQFIESLILPGSTARVLRYQPFR